MVEHDKTPNAFYAPLESAVDFALGGLSVQPKDFTLRRLALNVTDEVDMKTLVNEIKTDTYGDILKARDTERSKVRNKDLDGLPNIAFEQRVVLSLDSAREGKGEMRLMLRWP